MTSFGYYASSSSAVLADQVGTFNLMNMVFSTTYEAITTTVQLRITSFATPFP
jgi:hypothetical protein